MSNTDLNNIRKSINDTLSTVANNLKRVIKERLEYDFALEVVDKLPAKVRADIKDEVGRLDDYIHKYQTILECNHQRVFIECYDGDGRGWYYYKDVCDVCGLEFGGDNYSKYQTHSIMVTDLFGDNPSVSEIKLIELRDQKRKFPLIHDPSIVRFNPAIPKDKIEKAEAAVKKYFEDKKREEEYQKAIDEIQAEADRKKKRHQLALSYYKLPFGQREQIATRLGIFVQSEIGDTEIMKAQKYFARAAELDKLDSLQTVIEKELMAE